VGHYQIFRKDFFLSVITLAAITCLSAMREIDIQRQLNIFVMSALQSDASTSWFFSS